ncbi:MAG: sigma-70 family RNA polymerase sigma factor [Synergistaceae bacterium]|nr:sigma-70 family RNA polymerase sigma factor [Synergistaceae bacterium]
MQKSKDFHLLLTKETEPPAASPAVRRRFAAPCAPPPVPRPPLLPVPNLLPAVPAPDIPLRLREIIEDYTQLVLATACRYQGRGADLDDLKQEGYLALIRLVPQCPGMKWLAYYLKTRLPGHVRDAAARLRRARAEGGELLLEELEESFGADEERYAEAELWATLGGVLTAKELEITRALSEGQSHRESAERLGVSQQAVAERLKKIRVKVRGALAVE